MRIAGWGWTTRIRTERLFRGVVLASALWIALASGRSELKAAESAPSVGGIALAIVYDTSGSMQHPARGQDGTETPKYQIAARTLLSIVDQLESVVATRRRSGPFDFRCGLIAFNGKSVREAVPFADFDARAIRDWLGRRDIPRDSTPLGRAVALAGERLMASPIARKHILVVTDGVNTAGPEPAAEIGTLRARAKSKGATVGIHFVAFDVQANVFDSVKRLDCTVMGAADEVELKRTLEAVLAEKILLEDEEPPAGATPRKER